MLTIDQAGNLCEKAMVQAKDEGGRVHLYMAGFVDALFDSGLITEDDRGTLYFLYADRQKIDGINH